MVTDWTKIYKKYKGFWIALKDDEVTVVGKGKSAREALVAAARKGYNDPILTRVPEKLITFVGAH